MATSRRIPPVKESVVELPVAHPWPIMELDGVGCILRANAATETFFGLDEASLPGLRINLPLKEGVSAPGKVGLGNPLRAEGEVEQASLTATRSRSAAWSLMLVPPLPLTGESSLRRKFQVTLSMQVAMRLLDPIRLASQFAEKIQELPDPRQADYLARLRKNLRAAREKVAILREYLEIANREYRFEILDFKQACDSTLPIMKRKWPGLKMLLGKVPPLLFLGNEYLFQLLLENLAGFALAGEKPATMLLVQAISPSPARPRHATLVVQCRGKGTASLSPSAAFRDFQSLDPDVAISDPGLYLARQIMDLHEGKMRFESTTRGSGISIFLSFPVLPLH